MKKMFSDEANKDDTEGDEGNDNFETSAMMDLLEEEDEDHINELAKQEEKNKEKNKINELLDSYIYDEENFMWCQLTFNVGINYYCN